MTLLIAAEKGLREEVEALREEVEAGCDVDRADEDGATPLLKAAEKGHGEVVEALIKGGCDADKARNDGARHYC
jgi:ankyrin repeat protein